MRRNLSPLLLNNTIIILFLLNISLPSNQTTTTGTVGGGGGGGGGRREEEKPTSSRCKESSTWPEFCTSILNTKLLNTTNLMKLKERIEGDGKDMFCDMVRVLNRIDCAQPFTVSPTWRISCQEAYRDWICTIKSADLFPPSLPPCDSTCHQVIRSCPYITPDRSQLDIDAKSILHPSQYGGHPTFYCPTTTTAAAQANPNQEQQSKSNNEDYFFSTTSTCIIFNPNELKQQPTHAHPIKSLDLKSLNFTFCHEFISSGIIVIDDGGEDGDGSAKPDKIVNVSHCCWTWTSALPLNRIGLASTMKSKKDIEIENCFINYTNIGGGQSGSAGGGGQSSSAGGGTGGDNPILLQCFITSDGDVGSGESLITYSTANYCYSSSWLLILLYLLTFFCLMEVGAGLGG